MEKSGVQLIFPYWESSEKKKTVLEPERVMGFATEGHARLGVTDRPRREGTARSEIKDRVTQTSSHTP